MPGRARPPIVALLVVLPLVASILLARGADLQQAGPGPGDGGAADRVAGSRLVTPPYMGVSTYPNSPAIATRFGLPHRPGLVVVQVDPNGPAARAGVKVNDVITAVDGRPVTEAGALYEELAEEAPGSRCVLLIARGNQMVSVSVPLGSA
jgi:S1-C subfamily serine protease